VLSHNARETLFLKEKTEKRPKKALAALFFLDTFSIDL
jgi:hypothetical protein